MRRITPALAACCLLTACSPGGGDGADGARVEIRLLAFHDADITVPAGTTVSWANAEDLAHTVTTGDYTVDPMTKLRCADCGRPDGLLDAQLPSRGSTARFTFRTAGTFTYYCDFHRGMNGTVTVTP